MWRRIAEPRRSSAWFVSGNNCADHNSSAKHPDASSGCFFVHAEPPKGIPSTGLANGAAAQLEPGLGGLVVRAGLGQALPKPVGMVQVIQVNQFVQNHIVPDKGRDLY